jgi:hypothetical protein
MTITCRKPTSFILETPWKTSRSMTPGVSSTILACQGRGLCGKASGPETIMSVSHTQQGYLQTWTSSVTYEVIRVLGNMIEVKEGDNE